MSEKLCLKWKNHINVMKEFKNFLSDGKMVDVTLACDGQSIKAHKIVLAACSPFFRSLFSENPCEHPIVVLKDIKYAELKGILDYMYCGEVNITEGQLSALVKTAETLSINGLGVIASPNDHTGHESESMSSDEYESQSDYESDIESVCTIDVLNCSFKSKSDQNSDGDSEPELKQETDVMNDNVEDRNFLLKNGFQNSMPNLVEQTLTTDSLPRQSFQLSSELSKEMNQSRKSNSTFNLLPKTVASVSSDVLLVGSRQSMASNSFQLPGKAFESTSQSSIEVNQSHKLNNIYSLLPKTATSASSDALVVYSKQSMASPISINSASNSFQLTGKSFQSTSHSSIEVNQSHKSNTSSLLPKTASSVSSDALVVGNKQSMASPISINSASNSFQLTGKSFESTSQSSIEVNQSHKLNNTSSLLPKTASSVSSDALVVDSEQLVTSLAHINFSSNSFQSQEQSCESLVRLVKKLNQSQSNNTSNLLPKTAALVSSDTLGVETSPSERQEQKMESGFYSPRKSRYLSHKIRKPNRFMMNDFRSFKKKKRSGKTKSASVKKLVRKVNLKKIPLRKTLPLSHNLRKPDILMSDSNSKKVFNNKRSSGKTKSSTYSRQGEKMESERISPKTSYHLSHNLRKPDILIESEMIPQRKSSDSPEKINIQNEEDGDWGHQCKKVLHKCQICPFKTMHSRNLRRHIDSVHEKKKYFACVLCSYQTYRSDKMKQHLIMCKKQVTVT